MSTRHGSDGIVSPVERLRTVADGMTRYDLVLVAIPLAILLGVTFGSVLAATRTGLTAGTGVALVPVVYALFGDPPTGNGPNGRRPA